MVVDYGNLRAYLWDQLPFAREAITDIDDYWAEDVARGQQISPYTYFWDLWCDLFLPLFERDDDDAEIINFLRTVDPLFEIGDEGIQIALAQTILGQLPNWPKVRLYAPPTLRKELARNTGDNSWIEPR